MSVTNVTDDYKISHSKNIQVYKNDYNIITLKTYTDMLNDYYIISLSN